MTKSPPRPLPQMPVAAALRRWRRLNGVKQAALAADLGVSQPTLSRWERGLRQPEGRSAKAVRALLAARPSSASDQALKALVEGAAEPVHLICDSTHRLLAASPARARLWHAGLAALKGHSLWPYASDGIAAAEGSLENLGWYAPLPEDVVVTTEAAVFDALTIPHGQIRWTRLSLSDGSFARLVRDGPGRRAA